MRAMVLAAGYGTRLGNLTCETPKGMLDIAGKPLLEHIIINLKRHGFDEIAVNLHFRPDDIKNHFGNGSKWGVSLTWSHETTLLGTAGGIKRMENFLRESEMFLVHYGDILTDQDLSAMRAFHRKRAALATLLLHQRQESNSLVQMKSTGEITSFLERPQRSVMESLPAGWVNSGICICAPTFLDFVPATTPSDLPKDVFTHLVGTSRLFGFPLTGYRCAIDSPRRLADARSHICRGVGLFQ